MKKILQRAAIVAVAACAPMTFAAAVTPAVSQAVPNCVNGWWDPAANTCRAPVSTTPLACDNGWWWEPVANVCRPPLLPPQ